MSKSTILTVLCVFALVAPLMVLAGDSSSSEEHKPEGEHKHPCTGHHHHNHHNHGHGRDGAPHVHHHHHHGTMPSQPPVTNDAATTVDGVVDQSGLGVLVNVEQPGMEIAVTDGQIVISDPSLGVGEDVVATIDVGRVVDTQEKAAHDEGHEADTLKQKHEMLPVAVAVEGSRK